MVNLRLRERVGKAAAGVKKDVRKRIIEDKARRRENVGKRVVEKAAYKEAYAKAYAEARRGSVEDKARADAQRDASKAGQGGIIGGLGELSERLNSAGKAMNAFNTSMGSTNPWSDGSGRRGAFSGPFEGAGVGAP